MEQVKRTEFFLSKKKKNQPSPQNIRIVAGGRVKDRQPHGAGGQVAGSGGLGQTAALICEFPKGKGKPDEELKT